ncbi:MAG: glycosyltransferase [Flavobacterium sp.]|uniref:glycosyltransferase family 2 protein n=1 Tax=Flavobacterium sp. TaxID=239 RepID=UPI0022C96C0E|nr:glycosyltransferase family 2 protein [Flavobacterium sp.]MCZ8197286.1 glycosyltransferase [Flavobacterium sp.]
MNLSLVICTYMRPKPLVTLLDSIVTQTKKPNEIIIVDGSINDETKKILNDSNYNLSIKYFLIEKEQRGLTKQRNFGVSKVSEDIEIISFLDDDIILEPNYFEEISKSFQDNKNAIGVGGIDLKENIYFEIEEDKKYNEADYFIFDGWVCKESARNKIRKKMGLMSSLQPDLIPEFSHGRSALPPNGKTYKVDHFMGGIATYKKDIFNSITFSTFFEGYGLYEDFDFCVRASHFGDLLVNTNAKVWHYHAPSGRPNQFKYGKMVVRNGWYVWRVKYPNPSFKAKLKWHAITLLLIFIRFFNIFTTSEKKSALTESTGRFIAWLLLFVIKPKEKK